MNALFNNNSNIVVDNVWLLWLVSFGDVLVSTVQHVLNSNSEMYHLLFRIPPKCNIKMKLKLLHIQTRTSPSSDTDLSRYISLFFQYPVSFATTQTVIRCTIKICYTFSLIVHMKTHITRKTVNWCIPRTTGVGQNDP